MLLIILRLVLQVEKRYNYTTPKTFLELIKLYKSVLARKRNQVQEAIDRLDTVSGFLAQNPCNLLKTPSVSPKLLFMKYACLRCSIVHGQICCYCWCNQTRVAGYHGGGVAVGFGQAAEDSEGR